MLTKLHKKINYYWIYMSNLSYDNSVITVIFLKKKTNTKTCTKQKQLNQQTKKPNQKPQNKTNSTEKAHPNCLMTNIILWNY